MSQQPQSVPILAVVAVAFVLLGRAACDAPSFSSEARAQERDRENERGAAHMELEAERGEDSNERLSKREFERRVPWSYDTDSWPRAALLDDTFEPPDGFARITLEPGSFGRFLRHLPLRLDRDVVLSYDDSPLSSPAAAIAMLPVGDRNLQQCADAIVRLHAEYLWAEGRRDAIGYHFTSGDRSTWSDWSAGERCRIDGSEVERVRTAEPSSDRETFVAYLRHLFTYAGTRSLRLDSTSVPADSPIRPGDFFLDPGSPGHAVLVLDVAMSGSGERIALLGQSFMPAQEFHVLEGGDLEDVWFRLPSEAGDRLKTPVWPAFDREDARRFE